MGLRQDLDERLKAALADRYGLESEIGSGGMATVYLAQDLKHDRKVAVKVLKPELAAVLGGERFLSEIKVTANLQHPHILPLHDSGEADGFLFYVMPFVEGESLRAKVDREKQLSIDEAVGIAKSVAKALDYAHRHGVIHRDIKPANILLHDGQPMVADFGIALAVRAAGGARLTETGLSLGTPQYMSPEQASGDREVDGRSDLYSLGAVLYEMLTGEAPHSGPTVQAIIAKLLTDKPRPVTELRETVPEHVAAVVHKALAKLPADRFGTALDLGKAFSTPSVGIQVETAAPSGNEGPGGWPRPRERIVWSLVTVAALTVGGWGVFRDTGPTSQPQVVRSQLVLGDSVPMVFVGAGAGGAGWRAVSISRDGEKVIYVGLEEGTPRLFLKTLSTGDTRVLEGTDSAFAPFFSWDGESVGFFVRTDLFTLGLRSGSRPVQRAEFPNPTAGAWGPDDVITCSVAIGYELRRISLTTGEEEAVDTEGGTLFPHLLPGGRKAITARTGGTLWIVDLEDGAATPLGLRGTEGRYLPTGHLLYHVGTDLYVTPFDLDNPTGVAAGEPVLFGVRTEVYLVGQFDVSETGTLVYAPGGFEEGRLARVGFDGSKETLPYPSRVYSAFQISPDSSRLAISYGSPAQGIVFLGLDRERVEPLTRNRFNNIIPIWSPDGSTVAYTNDAAERLLPVVHPVGGDPVSLPVPESWDEAYPESWSGNGYMALGVLSPGSFDIMALDLETGEVVEVAATDALEWASAFSPDGNWIAYTSDEQSEYGVYIQSFPPDGEAQLVSQGYGEEPVWSRDGSTLFYRSVDRFMAVDVQTHQDRTLTLSDPREVWRGRSVNIFHRSFDVWPDGQSLLLVESEGEETTAHLEMIQGWFQEIQEMGEGGGS